MKTIKNYWTNRIKVNILFLLLLGMVGCSGDEPVPQIIAKSSNKQITGFVFLAAENVALNEDVVATINESSKTITATLPGDTPLKSLKPAITVSELASISPTGPQDFTNPVAYIVTAADGTKANYVATLTNTSKSGTKQISNFEFLLSDGLTEIFVRGNIDESTKTIAVIMPVDTRVSSLSPEIEISEKASINPTAPQNFNYPVSYTVTAEDGSQVDYTVIVETTFTQRGILQFILDDNPDRNFTWNLESGVNVGSLAGVTTGEDGNITELVLSTKGLVKLPEEISRLTALTILDLPSNKLTYLPIEIGQLKNLRYLNLTKNLLTSLPSEIGQLTALTVLGLWDNQLNTLPQEIGNLSNLDSLFMHENQLASIPVQIGNLTNLKLFYCGNNPLNALPPEIGKLKNLERLDIGSGNLTTIPMELGQLTKLKYLNLYNNQLTALPPELGKLIALESLYLIENQLTSLPPELGFLTKLTSISVRNNNLTSIPNAICNLKKFVNPSLELVLDAGTTCETSAPLDALISIVVVNPVNTLGWTVDQYPGVERAGNGNIVGLKIQAKGIQRIPEEVASIPSLRLLDVRDNPLTFISPEVCKLQAPAGILNILTDPGEGCN